MARLPDGVREKRPGYFEVRLYAGLDPLTRKQTYVSRSVRGTAKDAARVRAELVLELSQRPGVVTEGTVGFLFERVLEHLEALGREAWTLHGYASIAKRASEKLGHLPLRKLGAQHLDAFYASLRKQGLKASTIRRYHAFIHRALTQARRWGWVQVNVADLASPPPVYNSPVSPPPAEAVASLMRAAANSRNPELELAVRLLAMLGGRRGEVCGLQWRDVDLKRNVVTIRRAVKQLPRQPVIVGDVKSHQERTLSIDAGTAAELAAHRSYVEDRASVADEVLVRDSFVLASTIDGSEPWKPNRLSQAVKRLESRSDYRGRLHDLRHWNASHLLDAGESVVTVAERLGHRDATTTLRVYAHVMPKADQRAAEILGRALEGQ